MNGQAKATTDDFLARMRADVERGYAMRRIGEIDAERNRLLAWIGDLDAERDRLLSGFGLPELDDKPHPLKAPSKTSASKIVKRAKRGKARRAPVAPIKRSRGNGKNGGDAEALAFIADREGGATIHDVMKHCRVGRTPARNRVMRLLDAGKVRKHENADSREFIYTAVSS